jgi:hypothetical protein
VPSQGHHSNNGAPSEVSQHASDFQVGCGRSSRAAHLKTPESRKPHPPGLRFRALLNEDGASRFERAEALRARGSEVHAYGVVEGSLRALLRALKDTRSVEIFDQVAYRT